MPNGTRPYGLGCKEGRPGPRSSRPACARAREDGGWLRNRPPNWSPRLWSRSGRERPGGRRRQRAGRVTGAPLSRDCRALPVGELPRECPGSIWGQAMIAGLRRQQATSMRPSCRLRRSPRPPRARSPSPRGFRVLGRRGRPAEGSPLAQRTAAGSCALKGVPGHVGEWPSRRRCCR